MRAIIHNFVTMSDEIEQNSIKPSVKTKKDSKLNEDQFGDKTTTFRNCLEVSSILYNYISYYRYLLFIKPL